MLGAQKLAFSGTAVVNFRVPMVGFVSSIEIFPCLPRHYRRARVAGSFTTSLMPFSSFLCNERVEE